MLNVNKKAAGILGFQTADQNDNYDSTETSSISKRFPPFGRQLMKALEAGKKPKNDIFVFVGAENAWRKAKVFSAGQWACVFESCCSPDQFCWDFVRCFSVLILETDKVDYEIIRCLAFELLSAGAFIVYAVTLIHKLVVFRQGGHHDA